MKNEIYIGIDPGVKTGIAIWVKQDNPLLNLFTCSHIEGVLLIYELINDFLNKKNYDLENIHLIIEDANQKGSWGKSAMSIGKLKQKSMDWIELGEILRVNVVKVDPKSRRNTKMKKEYFKQLTGYEGQTSEHARDAAMLVFGK